MDGQLVYVAGIFFTADIFVNFHIAYPKKSHRGETKIEVPDGKQVAKEYVLHGGFIIDLIAVIPAYIEVSSASVIPTSVQSQIGQH